METARQSWSGTQPLVWKTNQVACQCAADLHTFPHLSVVPNLVGTDYIRRRNQHKHCNVCSNPLLWSNDLLP